MTLQDFTGETGADAPFAGLPAGTEMSHVQLKVTDAELQDSEPFYTDLLGFDVQGRLGQMFLAVGVHQHRALLVVTNRFSTGPAGPPLGDSAQLIAVDLLVSSADQLQVLAERLAAASWPHTLAGSTLTVSDPSGNVLCFRAETV
ncbi:hypothetical protein [Streptomyces sp. NPDC002588]|uniref:VOC family protein n=1 Tax=Streptomyces sp. NPDC002588 TaxID=3154419 RepID=UPI0033277584